MRKITHEVKILINLSYNFEVRVVVCMTGMILNSTYINSYSILKFYVSNKLVY